MDCFVQRTPDRIVKLLDVFEDFASHYRQFVSGDATPTGQKQMLQKFIGRVETGTESVKVHWIVDGDHFDREWPWPTPAPLGALRQGI